MKVVYTLMLFLFVTISCLKEDSKPNIINPDPYQVGHSWTYEYNNQRTGQVEEYKQTIVRKDTMLGGLLALVVVVEYQSDSLLNYWYWSGDTLRYSYSQNPQPVLGYVLPLSTGKVWTEFNITMIWDSTKVGRKFNIPLFNGKTYAGYDLIKEAYQFEGGYNLLELYIPTVGMVKTYRSQSTEDTFENVIWKLVSINFTPAKTS